MSYADFNDPTRPELMALRDMWHASLTPDDVARLDHVTHAPNAFLTFLTGSTDPRRDVALAQFNEVVVEDVATLHESICGALDTWSDETSRFIGPHSPASVAQSLRDHLNAEQLACLKRVIVQDGELLATFNVRVHEQKKQ